MTGSRGPVPKRSDERRRRNKPDAEVVTAPSSPGALAAPDADESWHPLARDWFSSLATSGQAVFFEPSDWQQARVAAEVLHRMLETRTRSGAPAVNGQALSAWLSMTTTLMVTEGDRRRLRVELQRGTVADADEDHAEASVVTYLAAVES